MLEEVRARLKTGVTIPMTVWDPANDETEYTLSVTVSSNQGERIQVIGKSATEPAIIAACLQPKSVVGLTMEADEPVYIAYPYVVEPPQPKQWEDPTASGYNLIFWLQLDDKTQIESIQRRRHVRIPMSIPIMILSDVASDRPLPGRTINISGGGIKIACAQKFTVGQILSLKIKFEQETSLLEVQARVVSCHEKPDNLPTLRYSISCAFFNLGKHEETLIMKECFRRELGMKKKT